MPRRRGFRVVFLLRTRAKFFGRTEIGVRLVPRGRDDAVERSNAP